MSREEEIKQSAKNRADQYEHPVDWNRCYHHYIQGAEWADQHPRKGRWEGEKVIKWLRAHIDNYANYNIKTDECFVNDFEEDLRKAMEE